MALAGAALLARLVGEFDRAGVLAEETVSLGRDVAPPAALAISLNVLVTLAGRDILVGRALLAPTTPDDYAHLMVACLLHDIGYVRGILKDDDANGYVVDAAGGKVKLPRGSSDAALFTHHVDRSILFALDRIGAIEGPHQEPGQKSDRREAEDAGKPAQRVERRDDDAVYRHADERVRGQSDRSTRRQRRCV